MNKISSHHFSLSLCVAATLAGAALCGAQEITSTVTASGGIITDFSANALIIRAENSPEPLRYTYTKSTTYVDDEGNPVAVEVVKSGLPVTVNYIREGDRMIANRVVVHKKVRVTEAGGAVVVAEAAAPNGSEVLTPGMTVRRGTISEFSPDTIVIRNESSPEPIRYTYSKSTIYIDEQGQPVTMETVKSGLPVTVHYIKEGDRLIASRVIIHKSVRAPQPGETYDKHTKTTTTITTDKDQDKDQDKDRDKERNKGKDKDKD